MIFWLHAALNLLLHVFESMYICICIRILKVGVSSTWFTVPEVTFVPFALHPLLSSHDHLPNWTMGHNLLPFPFLVSSSHQVLVGKCLTLLCHTIKHLYIYILRNINSTRTYSIWLKELLWSLKTSWCNRKRIGWFRRKCIKWEGIFFIQMKNY